MTLNDEPTALVGVLPGTFGFPRSSLRLHGQARAGEPTAYCRTTVFEAFPAFCDW